MNQCFTSLANDKDCRAVVLTGAGKHFTAGLDLIDFQSLLFSNEIEDTGRKGFRIRKLISDMQESFNAVEKCPKPVIAAVHSACIGGGLDLISACDIRLCSKDAWFQIKEVDIGVLADVGTLQRLPKIVGNDSLVRELAYTARVFHSDEARGFGLVSRVLADRQTCVDAALQMAADIASKSPVAVQGTKVNIVFSRDHTVAESLDYASVWNSFAIQSEDTLKAGQAFLTKTKPTFSKL
ncbi:delta(3,5)-Delta(2,4)-dienoyl-CoA isomerase, mitochondrial-like isoform X2 [Corticium candelabrum]|nr:delta(3,5)-Delta(2,4)-dienoyl-CoA isomerase, mitochondrial-like isoform X2 [Corticium candelabrum]